MTQSWFSRRTMNQTPTLAGGGNTQECHYSPRMRAKVVTVDTNLHAKIMTSGREQREQNGFSKVKLLTSLSINHSFRTSIPDSPPSPSFPPSPASTLSLPLSLPRNACRHRHSSLFAPDPTRLWQVSSYQEINAVLTIVIGLSG